ncbi:MAG: ABC transporter substrate-binding protein, partial [Actinomycetota bacterium]
MTLASRTRAFLLLLVAALALAACADDVEETADEPDEGTEDADGDDPDDDPDDAEGDADGDDPDAEPAALEANLTDRCAEEGEADLDLFPEQASFEHAERVDVTYHDDHKVVEVATTFTDEPLRFVLLQCGVEPPELEGDLAEAPLIEVPVEEAVTLTTVNIAHFDALDAVDRLVGVGTTDFVTTDAVRERIDAGEVAGYGTPEGPPDAERLIAAAPDVAVLDAFGDTVLDDVALLDDADIDVLLNADFDEPTPLGRAEWLKVTALLLNREADAEALFDGITEDYAAVAEAVADVEERPRVLLDEPFEGTWFAPGGQSLSATL